MKNALLLLLLALPMLAAGDLRAHLAGSTLDVYVSQSTEKADIPGAPAENNTLLVSVKSADDQAQAVMVWIMVRLNDQTRTTRTAILRNTGNCILFRFPLGEKKAIELVDIKVDNLRKTFGDALAAAY